MDIDEMNHADDDTEVSESDSESYDDENEDQDDDWSGEDGNLEATVIAAVDGDLDLAAFLIPLIHNNFNSTIRRKIESWRQYGAASSSADSSGSGAHNGSASTSSNQSPTNSRKRQRLGSNGIGGENHGNEEEEEEDEDRDMNPKNREAEPQDLNSSSLMLACPFNKLDSTKYSQHNTSGQGKRTDYRTCAGPGFKSIQRLKYARPASVSMV